MVKSARTATPPTFEAALTELETIVRAMEGGQLPLEESLTTYERGTSLLKFCQEALNAADQKIKMLEGGALQELQPANTLPPPPSFEDGDYPF